MTLSCDSVQDSKVRKKKGGDVLIFPIAAITNPFI